ncbi:hypothetical protein JCM3774_005199 [Rhodotorula dairenensis]
MPHTNSQSARDRKASRSGRKPAFLQKKAKSTASTKAADPKVAALGSTSGTAAAAAFPEVDPTIPKGRQHQTALIRRFHAIEKQLASPALTDPDERNRLELEREQLGGLETYQAASQHGGDKIRGGESSKWLVKQIKDLKIGVAGAAAAVAGKDQDGEQQQAAPKKVEPTILEDGTKVWPKVERRKLRLLDIGAIAGTAYTGYPWISTTSIDLNPQSDSVLRYNFFEFPVPQADADKYDIVALSLVMNYEGSLVNRGHMLLHAHDYLLPHGYLYLVLPLPCLTNSRYLSHARLTSILTSTGWTVARQHDSAKLTYWLLRRSGTEGTGEDRDGREWKREVVRKGAQRNNFCVLVQPGTLPVVSVRADAGKDQTEDGTAIGAEQEQERDE